jgi:hypothetical protein
MSSELMKEGLHASDFGALETLVTAQFTFRKPQNYDIL